MNQFIIRTLLACAVICQTLTLQAQNIEGNSFVAPDNATGGWHLAELSTDSLRSIINSNEKVLVHFFEGWCAGQLENLPYYVKARQQLSDSGITYLMILDNLGYEHALPRMQGDQDFPLKYVIPATGSISQYKKALIVKGGQHKKNVFYYRHGELAVSGFSYKLLKKDVEKQFH